MSTNDKIIIPTIGRRVWFWPARNAEQSGFISHDEGTPMDAGVVYVWGDRMVNLDVTDHAGNHHAFTSVALVQPDDEPPINGRYCQWMPYQVGQAKVPVVTAAAAAPEAVQPPGNTGVLYAAIKTAMDRIGQPPSSQPTCGYPRNLIDAYDALFGAYWSDCPIPSRVTYRKVYNDGTAVTGPASLPALSPAQIEGCGLLSFGIALDLLRHGAKIARTGWNGKGMFVYLVPPASYPVQTAAAASHFGEGSMVPYNAYMALKTVEGSISTWVPSVSDCLADDWVVVE